MLVGLSLVQGKQPKPLKDCHQLVCVCGRSTGVPEIAFKGLKNIVEPDRISAWNYMK